ncbi:MAG: heavy metal translocating P-type ATPase [Eubacteriales bacterium]
MTKFNVSGMHCSACSSRLEKCINRVPGVEVCNVNLLTNSMTVSGSASVTDIITAVENAGFEAEEVKEGEEKSESDDESAPIIKRLLYSFGLLVVLAYFSMGVMIFSLPLPTIFEQNPIYVALIQFVTALSIMIINRNFFISGFSSIMKKSPNMDSLVSIGSLSAFIWSSVLLFLMYLHPENAQKYNMDLYFDSAGMILALITVGKLLETISKGKTTSALKSLLDMSPKTATVIRDGKEFEIPAKDIRPSDIFLVRPGENIAADGIVCEGSSEVSEASLTGESMPVSKEVGSEVFAATINQNGFLKCEAKKVGNETVFAQIIKLVENATQSKAPIAKLADKVSAVFVPTVITIAILTFIIWLSIGQNLAFALARAISVLVISCPCALGLATPVAIMVGSGRGAKLGILFKDAVCLETAGRVTTVLLDKTGTITKGAPAITNILPMAGICEEELLATAFCLESKSRHPLATAITNSTRVKNIKLLENTDFESLSGLGIKAFINEKICLAGSVDFIKENSDIPPDFIEKAISLANEGNTPIAFSSDGQFLGIIAVADEIKHDAEHAITSLHKMGIKTIMLTGDNENTANAIAKKVGIDMVSAKLMPDQKFAEVSKYKSNGICAMVGDGINDAPALTAADLGIAIGAGSDVAIDSAGIVLMQDGLSQVVSALSLGRATLRNIKQNLFWAFIYNIIGIPLAAGLFASFGIYLNPMIAAAAMSMSSFFVISNSLRLNFIKLRD